MSATTHLRLASVCAAAYGVLLVSGIVHHFQRSGSFRALAHSLSQPTIWVALVVILLVAFGLWRRYAWAWWLGLAAAGYQLFRLAVGYVQGPQFGHLPRASLLVSLALLLAILLLLSTRKARLGANR